MAKLTWKKEPNETGLRRVAQGPRGAILSVDGKQAGTVSALRNGWREYSGWYFVAGWDCPGVTRENTCSKPVATLDEAKVACEGHVRKCLGLPPKKVKGGA